jgi:hypothetical protein
MNSLNVYTVIDYDGEYSTQVWQYLYSYKQYKAYPNSTNIDIKFNKIELSNLPTLNKSVLSILHLSMSSLDVLEKVEHLDFDLIFVDNMCEHLSVGSVDLLEQLSVRSNMYMIVGSFVHPEHHLYDKCITMPRDWLNCRSWYTNPKAFVSYYSDNTYTKVNGMLYIGGELRSYRKFIIDLLSGDSIRVMQNSSDIVATNDMINGTELDQLFVNECNDLYGVAGVHKYNKFYNTIKFGLEEYPFGRTSIAYLILPEYNTYKCILYSEASFMNNEIYPTEKTWKCAVTKTHWIMFAGKNSYKLMADYGIRSILELVPGGIGFDNISNHADRFTKQTESVKYLQEHPEIFDTTEANDILDTNYAEFLTGNKFMMPLVNKLDEILEKHI